MSVTYQEVYAYKLPPGLDKICSSLSPKKISQLFDESNQAVKHYHLGNLYPDIYFTRQEARCMFYFLQGFTNQQVGGYLGLSDRTVGSYASNMQRKLRLRNKKKMIEIIKQTDFLAHFLKAEIHLTEC
jgi:DNA-binding CsgD family transcriptional regulator